MASNKYTFRIKSRYLNEITPVLVQKPEDYQPAKSYPVVYMLHGYSEHFKQWSEITDLRELATDYQMVLVCPEGFASYYLNSPNLKNSQYEDFFIQELVPEIEKKTASIAKIFLCHCVIKMFD